MGSFRFIHAADLHLDSPMRGLSELDSRWQETFGQATRHAFSNLITAALDHEVAFLILAGDLFDGDWKDFRTGLFFAEQVGRLAREGIDTFLVFGNHDAACDISGRLPRLDRVHVFPRDAAETVHLKTLGVALHGRGYGTRDEDRNLARTYPEPLAQAFNIGILHTAMEGREGHDKYAPCDLDDLLAKGYDYWALGHVHKREVINDNPPVVFSGNLQGRHANERGSKGAYLVTVGDNGRAELTFLELDVARWQRIELNAEAWRDWSDFGPAVRRALGKVAETSGGRPMAVRVIVHGETPLHGALLNHASELEEELGYASADQSAEILIEQLVVDTRAPKHPDPWAEEDVLARLLDHAAQAAEDDLVMAPLREEINDLLSKLPSETPRKPAEQDFPDLFSDALELLRARLREENP